MGGPFNSQSADLHCVWSAYSNRHLCRELGQLILSELGYPHWMGEWTIALCQLRDNVLMATDAPCANWGMAVELVRGVLQRAWGLPVVCPCIFDDYRASLGACCGNVCKAMGVVFVKDSDGKGMAYTEPTALTDSWNMRLVEPLLSPGYAYPGYLGGIFTRVLKNGLAFVEVWVAQIFSAAAWLQVAHLSRYKRTEAMRAMHKGLHKAHATSPHDANSTIKAVHSTSYTLLGTRTGVAQHVLRWMDRHAYW